MIRFLAEFSKNGSYARLRCRGGSGARGTRGAVKGFSRASRKRLLDLFNKIPLDVRRNALFVTLTYPSQWPDDWAKWKRHLDTFVKRVLRRWPRGAMIWRLEFQKRGAPHFHLVVFGVPFVPHRWVARAWFEIVDSGQPEHLEAGTEVRRCRNDKMAQYYISKYVGKEDDSEQGKNCCGRVWGVRGRDSLGIVICTIRLPAHSWYSIRRTLRNFLARRLKRRVRWGVSDGQGLTVYISADTLLRLIDLEVQAGVEN